MHVWSDPSSHLWLNAQSLDAVAHMLAQVGTNSRPVPWDLSGRGGEGSGQGREGVGRTHRSPEGPER